MDKNVEKYVSEFMASHGRRALSEGELDQVVGGAFRKIDHEHAIWDGEEVDRESFDALIVNVNEYLGIQTAVNLLKDITGFDGTGMGNDIYVILNRFWG